MAALQMAALQMAALQMAAELEAEHGLCFARSTRECPLFCKSPGRFRLADPAAANSGLQQPRERRRLQSSSVLEV